jgi:hypothetical protein
MLILSQLLDEQFFAHSCTISCTTLAVNEGAKDLSPQECTPCAAAITLKHYLLWAPPIGPPEVLHIMSVVVRRDALDDLHYYYSFPRPLPLGGIMLPLLRRDVTAARLGIKRTFHRNSDGALEAVVIRNRLSISCASSPPLVQRIYAAYFTFAETRGTRGRIVNIEQKKTMSLYINNLWVWQQGRYWMAKAVAFSENGNDVTISACHDSPELAYRRLVAGMKELLLVPADWDE